MGLATPTKTFECEITDGLARVILNRPDRGNPIDGEFCREFSLALAGRPKPMAASSGCSCRPRRSLESQIEDEAQTLAAVSRTTDAREGIKAFQEKRKPVFLGR
jgi:enoyl-CoA hydratase/carnithine racemase